MRIENKVEALIFVAGNEGLSLNELAHLLNVTMATTYDILETMKKEYSETKETSLKVLEVGDRFLLTTKKEYATVIKEYAQTSINQSLSQAALECLSIVAYQQPITRSEIEGLRGVQSSGSVQKLVSRRLIEEKGRVEGPGRAILYGTTDYFLDYFGLKSIDDLPAVDELEEKAEEVIPNDLFFDRFKDQFDKIEQEEQGD
ncbi:MAG: SMC-Scp complex subunit ScpB [Vagococcus sp.]